MTRSVNGRSWLGPAPSARCRSRPRRSRSRDSCWAVHGSASSAISLASRRRGMPVKIRCDKAARARSDVTIVIFQCGHFHDRAGSLNHRAPSRYSIRALGPAESRRLSVPVELVAAGQPYRSSDASPPCRCGVCGREWPLMPAHLPATPRGAGRLSGLACAALCLPAALTGGLCATTNPRLATATLAVRAGRKRIRLAMNLPPCSYVRMRKGGPAARAGRPPNAQPALSTCGLPS
jgi:hypothetical protein